MLPSENKEDDAVRPDDLSDEVLAEEVGKDPVVNLFGRFFGFCGEMMRTVNPIGMPPYAPSRDMLYLAPHLIRLAIWTIYTYYPLKHSNQYGSYFLFHDQIVTRDSLMKAFEIIKELLEKSNSFDTCTPNLKQVAVDAGWYDINAAARDMIFTALGQTVLGSFYSSLYNSNRKVEDVDGDLSLIYDEMQVAIDRLERKPWFKHGCSLH